MRDKDPKLSALLDDRLTKYAKIRRLPGIVSSREAACLVGQIVDSVRRVEFVRRLSFAKLDLRRRVPYSGIFDPLRAAVLFDKSGNKAEAFWLVFLASHFGKHDVDGWLIVEAIYGRLNKGKVWSWNEYCLNSKDFERWYRANYDKIVGKSGKPGRFSNHRKYRSLLPDFHAGPLTVLRSYRNWLGGSDDPREMLIAAGKAVGQNPKEVFAHLYRTASALAQFGRLGKFDFLCMLAKLGIAPINPDSAYIDKQATGPLIGARLLFLGDTTNKKFDKALGVWANELADYLGIGYQEIEDAICNWQKSPSKYRHFRG